MREIFLKSVLSIGCGRGTPEEGGIGPGVDVVVDAVEFLWGGCGRGTPENGGISPGVDAVGDVLEVFWGWREGHQRKVASVRAGTPSGDTTRTP